jgi:hypothetical protein
VEYEANEGSLPPLKAGVERAGTHDKKVTSLPALISKYVLRIIVYDLTTIHSNGRSSIDIGGTNTTRASLGLPNQVHIQIQV